MNIAVDGGALKKNSTYGNARFSQCLIDAFRFDTHNTYTVYTQEPMGLREDNVQEVVIPPKKGWLQIYVAYSARKCDRFLALNQAVPLMLRSRTIAFHHGLAFHFFPHLYPQSAKKMEKQTQACKKARLCIVPSIKVRNELMEEYACRSHVIPYALPHFFTRTYKFNKRKRLILGVGMDHPIKNFSLLTKAFSIFQKKYPNFRLKIVHHASDPELLELYRDAHCLAVTSHYESFHFPTLEALGQNTPVVSIPSSTIPEFKPYVTCVSPRVRSLAQAFVSPRAHSIHPTTWKHYLFQLRTLYET